MLRSSRPLMSLSRTGLKSSGMSCMISKMYLMILPLKLQSGTTTKATGVDRSVSSSPAQIHLYFMWDGLIRYIILGKKLVWIKDEKDEFELSMVSVDFAESSSRETHSMVNKSKVLGRDKERDEIMEFILNCVDCSSLSVVPIVGLGGIGKTTVAQLLYNDSRIDENFQLKLWVCVSKKFNIKNILKEIYSSATGEEEVSNSTLEQISLEQLRNKICKTLKDKKYFLILDNVWNEDASEWIKLRELLDVGAPGSTVVVTTREMTVKTFCGYTLSLLSHGTCFEIFKQLAFKDIEEINPTFLGLAEQIVSKSRGLPLLVTTLGNLLHGNMNEWEWRDVIQRLEQGHEDIRKTLKLSYDPLPSNLKQCFHICSMYGKGRKLVPTIDLIPLWMALGFIPDDAQGEELGKKFIKELQSKSLFMKQEKTCFEYVFNVITLHDLVQDLAKSMVGEELATINRSCKRVTEKVRYMTVDEEDLLLDEDDLSRKKCHEKLLKQAKKAWVLMIMPAESCLSKTFLKNIISKLKSLRVLDLSDWQFEELPVMIGFMKHLRYLRLGANRGIKKLPDSICNLVNLQYLNLNGCCNLEKLPDEIGRLRNLKYLRVSTRQEVLPEGLGLLKGLLLLKLDCPNLKFLPKSINQLENLNYLQLTGCKELELGLESLLFEGLNNLRRLALLYLPKLQNLPIREDGRPSTCLEMLWVVGCPNFGELPYTLCVNKLAMLVINECPMFSSRYGPEMGRDWHLIHKIPFIVIDNKRVTNDVHQSSPTISIVDLY